MLRVLAGLMRPESGLVTVGDEAWCDTGKGVFLRPQQRHVGLVFQNYALMPHLSATENVALSLLHLPEPHRRAKAGQLLDHLGLSPGHQARRPRDLSGGEQQRVAVARALAREPRLLLLDEPFSAVDQMNRKALYRLLAELRSDLGIPIVLVTHDLNEARLLADRLVVMDGGAVLQQGTPEHIHRSPRSARIADLVGIHNRFHGHWIGPAGEPGVALLRWTSGDVAQHDAPLLRVVDKGRIDPDQMLTWVIPGDGITLVERPPADDDEFAVTVREARHLGEITLATLELDSPPNVFLQLTLSGPDRARVAQGDRATVKLDLGLVHVMPLRLRQQ
jgi:molybdate transport system ATP-binding protein